MTARIAAVLALFVAAGCGGADRPTNVVLIVMDTLRADRLSAYGYERPTSPNLEAWSARGVRFENVSSTSSWTAPAHASLFTGRHPIEHGATQEHPRLAGDRATLAERLAGAGYRTFGASTNPVVSVKSGLARGFEVFDENWREMRRFVFEQARRGESGPALTDHPNLVSVRRFLDGASPEEPFFLFVNFIEAHTPYNPPEPYRSLFLAPADRPLVARALEKHFARHYLVPESYSPDELRVRSDLYDGEIAYVDALVGALLEELEERGLLRDTFVFITSDHGENLGDHGHFGHVLSLYKTTVRVPLVALLPGGARAGEVVEAPVGLIDLYAAILAGAGLEPSGVGRDLLGPLDGEVPLFSEYYYPRQVLSLLPEGIEPEHSLLAPYLRRLRAVESGGMRLLWASDGRDELFDLEADPGERENLAGRPEVAAREGQLRALLDAFVANAGGDPPGPGAVRAGGVSPGPGTARAAGDLGDVDAESAERLRELGYLR